ncbi:MAG: hypothetical protein WCK51_05820 [Armatimonadota bacterium]
MRNASRVYALRAFSWQIREAKSSSTALWAISQMGMHGTTLAAYSI